MAEETKFESPNNTETAEASPEEQALVRHWNDVIEKCWDDHKVFRDRVRESRMYVRGEQHEDKSGKLVRANLLYSDIKAGVNKVYAKHPEISIRPAVAVDESRYSQVKDFAKTCETVLNRQLLDASLKRRAKAALRSADTTRIGWLKIDYQREYALDPIIMNRINDVQDNLLRLEAARKKLLDPHDLTDAELKRAHLQVLLSSLEEKKEVVAAEGLVIDHVLSEYILLDTRLIRSIDEFDQAPWIAHCIPMSIPKAEALFDKKIEGVSGYSLHDIDEEAKESGLSGNSSDSGLKSEEYLRVWEVWSKDDQMVYTFGEGGREWLREPYSPDAQPQQWYPFFPYSPDRVDGSFYPLSKVDRLKELQDEHNRARTRFAEVRDKNIPHTLYKKGAFTKKDVKTLANPDRFGFAGIEGEEGVPINQNILPGINPQIDPQVYMTEHTERDWGRSTEFGGLAGGFVSRPKSATEAAIVDQANNTQSSGDSDELEDYLTRIAKSVLEILLQELTVQQAAKIAGESAVWPPQNMPREEIFNLVSLEIKAGSTSKPNQALQQQLWTQFGPQIMDTVMRTNELISAGQIELAEVTMEILRESLSRFDVRIDLNDLFRGLIMKIKQAQQGPTEEQLMAQQRQIEAEQANIDLVKANVQKTQSEAVKDMALAKKAEDSGRLDFMEQLAVIEDNERARKMQAVELEHKIDGQRQDRDRSLFDSLTNALNKGRTG